MTVNQIAEVSLNYLADVAASAVPEGYKQTEVGLIPEDWEVKQLSTMVFSLETGVSVNSVDKSDVFPHGKHILKTSCVANGYFYEEECKSILPSNLVRAKCRPEAGSIIVSRMNTPDLVGEIGYVTQDCPNTYLPDRLWQMKFRKDIALNSRWLAYMLSFPSVAKEIKDAATGTSGSMKNIAKESLLLISLLVPGIDEQTAIANALSDVDALISEQEKLIAKKQAIKTATLQQLLTGRTRLPQFALHEDGSKKGYQQSALGEMPEDWEVVELGELLNYEQPTKYLVNHSRFLEEGSYPVLTAGKSFVLGYTEEQHGVYSELPVIIFDDFTTDSKFVDFPFKAKSSAMKMLKPKHKEMPLSLIYNLLVNVDYQVGDHKRHWIGEFKYIQVALPFDIVERTAIATILSDMDEEIQALQQRLAKTRQLKQGMMQQLLTGKIRLPVEPTP